MVEKQIDEDIVKYKKILKTNKKIINHLMGQVIKRTGGTADPEKVQEIILRLLE